MYRKLLCALAVANVSTAAAAASSPTKHPELDEMIARHARVHGVPLSLVHRVVVRESGYNPRLVHRRFWGLMQISYATAKSMGYKGEPRGLLDPDVNLTYAVPYLANAYKAADGDEARAVMLYASGYYYTAKRKRMLGELRNAASPSLEPAPLQPPPAPPEQTNPVVEIIRFIAQPAATPPAAPPPPDAAAPPAAQAQPVPEAAAAQK
jgi:soluble lytic murein transglycosylase-like protein